MNLDSRLRLSNIHNLNINLDKLEEYLKKFNLTINQINGIRDFISLNEDVKEAFKDKSMMYLAATFVFNGNIPDILKSNKGKIDDELERILAILNSNKRITEDQVLTQKFQIASYVLLLEKLKSVEETD